MLLADRANLSPASEGARSVSRRNHSRRNTSLLPPSSLNPLNLNSPATPSLLPRPSSLALPPSLSPLNRSRSLRTGLNSPQLNPRSPSPLLAATETPSPSPGRRRRSASVERRVKRFQGHSGAGWRRSRRGRSWQEKGRRGTPGSREGFRFA
jgi:hypothetical protein